jgi:hypothetical protein
VISTESITVLNPLPSSVTLSAHTLTPLQQTTAVCLKIKVDLFFSTRQTYIPLTDVHSVARQRSGESQDDLKKTSSYRLSRAMHSVKATLNFSYLRDGRRCGTVPLS